MEESNPQKKPRQQSVPARAARFGDISTVSGQKIQSPFETLGLGDHPQVADLTEALIEWTKNRYGVDEFIQAHKEFQLLTGRIYHDDGFYHEWMSYFLDYFTYQRPIQGSLRENAAGATPYELFIQSNYLDEKRLDESLKGTFRELKGFVHSLFLVLKVSKGQMLIKDIFSNEKYEIAGEGRLFFYGFIARSVLQGFLFIIKDRAYLSDGIIFHPRPVTPAIKKATKDTKKQGKDLRKLLIHLAKHNLTYVRHRQIDPKKIYRSTL